MFVYTTIIPIQQHNCSLIFLSHSTLLSSCLTCDLSLFRVQGNAVQSSEGGGSSSGGSGGLQRRDSAHRRASTLLPTKNNLLVISGGDGYEDFRLTNSSETVGRDDSTNHLLLWRV